ncbi:MAG: hypothetical protein Q8K98_14495 [Bacteroidota bacterium]|nr:hypothetical protein [Bacteroidota bacterium]
MSKSRIGALPARYSFFLNRYPDVRFSRCPKCRRETNYRKFALLIHVDALGLVVLGKTSRYCPVCELIIVHQDQLESQLASIYSQKHAGRAGNPYFVIGTVGLRSWKAGLRNPVALEQIQGHTAVFKYQLKFTPTVEQ